MSLYATAELHNANPPESWTVKRVARGRSVMYCVIIQEGGQAVDTFGARRDAEKAISDPTSWLRKLYDKESRWYAGEQIEGWRPYSEIAAEQEAASLRLREWSARVAAKKAAEERASVESRPAVLA